MSQDEPERWEVLTQIVGLLIHHAGMGEVGGSLILHGVVPGHKRVPDVTGKLCRSSHAFRHSVEAVACHVPVAWGLTKMGLCQHVGERTHAGMPTYSAHVERLV